MSDLLEIEALGGLRIRRGGVLVADVGSRKAEALLVYLARSRRPQPREVLADLLWDERSTAQALTNLRVLLTRLGKQFAPYLLTTRASVAFNQESSHWLDVVELEESLDTARAQHVRGDALAPGAVKDLERAVSLYGGPFLQGFYLRDSSGFEEWMLREQDRLQRLVGAALHDLVTYYLERGENSAGIGHAVHLLQLDPLYEETHRQLMLLLVLSGQRRAALEQYETCRRTLAAELGSEPSAATTTLYERIRAGDYTGTGLEQPADEWPVQPHRRVRPQYLPHPLTPFVGRGAELAELSGYLADPQCPLVTLVGPGGSGKTRLAVQAAQDSPGFSDGIYFVPLAPVGEPSFLIPAIADALQFSFSGPHSPQAQLFSHLSEKRLLLVLDNFEHLLEGADMLPDLLQAAPQIKLLVTSREPLDLSAEQIFDVAGLPVPSDGELEGVAKYDSVELFVQRARRAQTRFVLSPEVTPWVVHLCRLVEGLPLGIELAAVWVRERSCQEIAQNLEHDLDVLATTRRDVPARHRSLRAVFDQSWGLLTQEEQEVMRQVSVFRGGFDLEAAAQVTGAGRELLSRVVQQSLLRQTPSGRYEMHELLRQYAAERLQEAGEQEDAEAPRRHAQYFLCLAEEAEGLLAGAEQGAWLDRLEIEHDNLRAALRWAYGAGKGYERSESEIGLRLLGALGPFWDMRGHWIEGREWLTSLLVGVGGMESVAHAKALRAAGQLARRQGDHTLAQSLLEESLHIYRKLGDKPGTAGALNGLSAVASRQQDFKRSRSYGEKSLAIYRELGDKAGVANALTVLGMAAGRQEDWAVARASLEESLVIYHELGDKWSAATALNILGIVLSTETGHYDAARLLYEESLAIYRELGDRRGIATMLNGVGEALRSQGDYAAALPHYEESLAIYRDLGEKAGIAMSLHNQGYAALLHGEPLRAKELFLQSLMLSRKLDDKRRIAECLMGLASVAAADREPRRAAWLLGKGEALLEEVSASLDPADAAELERDMVVVRSQLAPPEFAKARAQGRVWTLDEVLMSCSAQPVVPEKLITVVGEA